LWKRLRITEDCNRIRIRRRRGRRRRRRRRGRRKRRRRGRRRRRGGRRRRRGGREGRKRMRNRPVNISERNLQNLTSLDINTTFRDGRDNDQSNFHISHRPYVCNL